MSLLNIESGFQLRLQVALLDWHLDRHCLWLTKQGIVYWSFMPGGEDPIGPDARQIYPRFCDMTPSGEHSANPSKWVLSNELVDGLSAKTLNGLILIGSWKRDTPKIKNVIDDHLNSIEFSKITLNKGLRSIGGSATKYYVVRGMDYAYDNGD